MTYFVTPSFTVLQAAIWVNDKSYMGPFFYIKFHLKPGLGVHLKISKAKT